MTRDQLTEARDRLRDLEQQTEALQVQADAEAESLKRAQIEARDGRGTLRQVVTAQGQAEAARGVLALHLGDVEQQRGRVQMLEEAFAVEQMIERGRVAQQEAAHAAQEAARVTDEAEAAITEALTRLQSLEGAYNVARGQAWEAARHHVAQALGITPGDVGDAVNWNRQGGLIGQAGADRRAAVAQALSDFAASIGTSDRDLIETANRAARELPSGRLAALMPRR